MFSTRVSKSVLFLVCTIYMPSCITMTFEKVFNWVIFVNLITNDVAKQARLRYETFYSVHSFHGFFQVKRKIYYSERNLSKSLQDFRSSTQNKKGIQCTVLLIWTTKAFSCMRFSLFLIISKRRIELRT